METSECHGKKCIRRREHGLVRLQGHCSLFSFPVFTRSSTPPPLVFRARVTRPTEWFFRVCAWFRFFSLSLSLSPFNAFPRWMNSNKRCTWPRYTHNAFSLPSAASLSSLLLGIFYGKFFAFPWNFLATDGTI